MTPAIGAPGVGGGGLLPASPWQDDSHLTQILYSDVFGWLDTEILPMTRAEAMTVPAVAAARHRICSTLARLPIRAYLKDTDTRWTAGSTALLTQPDPAEPQFQTLLQTLDDLFFTGGAWWAVTGFTQDETARQRPTSVTYVPRTAVTVDQEGRVTIDDEFRRRLALQMEWVRNDRGAMVPRPRVIARNPLAPDAPWMIWFAGPHDGLLNFGSRTIRASVAMDRAAGRAADNPVPSIELHQTNDADMSREQIQDMLRSWMKARRGENGGVGYTSAGVEARALGQQPEQLLVDGRNQQAVEVARLAGIPAASIDAALPGSSLTYANLMDRLRDLVDFGLQPYAVAVTGRLSMDDCLAATAEARWDFSSLVAPTSSAAAAAQTPQAAPPSAAAPIPEGTPAP